MNLDKLRAFDSKIINFAARLKEIWVSEKYRREKTMQKDESFRVRYYTDLSGEVKDLVQKMENTDFNESEFLDCREQYLNAGRSLEKAYGQMRTKLLAEELIKEFLFFMDNGASELNHLWKEWGKGQHKERSM